MSKVNKSQTARDIVTAVYADDNIDTNVCRSTAISRIRKALKCEQFMAATYHGNAVASILSVQERDGSIAEAQEKNKPVWSVVKISSEANPVTTSYYMFTTKKAAIEANTALRFDGVFKGEQEKGSIPAAA